MISFLSGRLVEKTERVAIIESRDGIGWEVFCAKSALKKMPQLGSQVKLWTYLQLTKDGAFCLYGFLAREEKGFFEALNDVAGIGPKTALVIMDVASVERLKAAIASGDEALLTRVSGIGSKSAQRIIVELKTKFKKDAMHEGDIVADLDAEEVLVELGYSRREARAALEKVSGDVRSAEQRIKEALRIMGKKA